MEKQFHLYCITNVLNGKKYIGITKRGAKARFRQHICDAKRYTTVLHRAIAKYGSENFALSVLAHANSYDELLHLEKLAISEHGTAHPNGYNMTEGGDANWRLVSKEAMSRRAKKAGDSMRGMSHPPEFGQKISAAKKGKPLSEANLKSIRERWSRPVVCVETGQVFKNGIDVVTWLKSKGFERATSSSVVACCRGNANISYGYKWAYADGSSPEFVPKTDKYKAVRSPDIPGVVFDKVTDAVNYLVCIGKTKAATSAVSKAANGKLAHAYGFRWEYV